MEALEVGEPGVVAGVDERLVAGLNKLAHAAAEHGLLAEQVGLGLLAEAGLDHAAAGAADALRVGEEQVAGVPGRVLVHRDEAGHAVALLVLAPHEVAGALGRDRPTSTSGPGSISP